MDVRDDPTLQYVRTSISKKWFKERALPIEYPI
jgi:hypothetical protein